jgi:redox-sensitive bicupin YhaK (pirin superfamily)
MITLRKSHERGHTDLGWLDSRHSFSFGEYIDPDHHNFGPLRVLNEERLVGSTGP